MICPDTSSLVSFVCFCSDFRIKRNIYARCGFFTDRNNNFQQKFLYHIEDIDFLSSNMKRFFLPRIINWKVLGVWKLPILPCSGLHYARFEEFFDNAKRVTRITYARQFIPLNKIVPNWNKTARIRAKPWIFRLSFKFYGAVITKKI